MNTKKLLVLFGLVLTYTMNLQSEGSLTRYSNENISAYDVGGAATASFLLLGGAWLTYSQLPLLAGKEPHATLLTKTIASILCILGVAIGLGGVTGLDCIAREKLNEDVRDMAIACFLLFGGAWLAHKQLPRLAGREIKYDAPQFTKASAWALFSVGILTGIGGTIDLGFIAREKLNS